VGHESHVEEGLARIPGDGISVEHVEDTEVAEVQDDSPAVDHGPELWRVGRLDDAVAAKSERLPQEQTRLIELGCLTSGLLQLEILDRATDSTELRERSFGDRFGNEVGFAAPPKLARPRRACFFPV
jgi:hypothetical protein